MCVRNSICMCLYLRFKQCLEIIRRKSWMIHSLVSCFSDVWIWDDHSLTWGYWEKKLLFWSSSQRAGSNFRDRIVRGFFFFWNIKFGTTLSNIKPKKVISWTMKQLICSNLSGSLILCVYPTRTLHHYVGLCPQQARGKLNYCFVVSLHFLQQFISNCFMLE